MEGPLYSSAVWNTSFEDGNTTSTTMDTSLATEDGSLMRYNVMDPTVNKGMPRFSPSSMGTKKLSVSRSSPGASIGKEMHNMLGYFDDVESFTTSPTHAKVSPTKMTLDDPIFSAERCFARGSIQSKADDSGAFFTTTEGGEMGHGKSVYQERPNMSPRRTMKYDLGVMHESEENDDIKTASPMSSSLPSQPSRRNSRSHTSQGIPSHTLFNGLTSIQEDRMSVNVAVHNELEKENEKLRSQLHVTKSRVDDLEEQLSLIRLRLEEEKCNTIRSNGVTQSHQTTSHNMVFNFPLPPYSVGSPSPHRGLPHEDGDTQDQKNVEDCNGGLSIANADHYHGAGQHHQYGSMYHAQPPINNSVDSSYSNSLGGFATRACRPSLADHDTFKTVGSAGNRNGDSRFDRKSNASMAESKVPADILVAWIFGDKSQDASITLQQQLKLGTPSRKAAIVQAMMPHILRLSEDRHGNFLVQRAVGADPQVAWQLKGHFVSLSLTQFGCHVVQQILDEDGIRSAAVEELLADRVFETLTCRNSIHVWQKILKNNWNDTSMRSRIYETVNRVMKGRWAEIAMQETGSIICQNIFESAEGSEKNDCMVEILDKLCDCAVNQWGVWVVQHIIEHDDSDYRSVALNKLLEEAVSLTLSQYGQKAIMSALKSRDPHFLSQYVDILCDRDASIDQPAAKTGYNMHLNGNGNGNPSAAGTTNINGASRRCNHLVDISSAPQGVQIITQLLTSVSPSERDRIIKSVRKNSVFLKGSKAGLRVHQLCERARAFTGY